MYLVLIMSSLVSFCVENIFGAMLAVVCVSFVVNFIRLECGDN